MDESVSFHELPLEHKYNYLLRHNKRLMASNSLLENYSKALEYQLKEAQKPVIVEKEVVKEYKVYPPNVAKMRSQIESLSSKVEYLTSENSNLKKLIRKGKT